MLLADERNRARFRMDVAHAVGWAFGGDKQQRQDWHHAQECAAGFHDHPLTDDLLDDGGMH